MTDLTPPRGIWIHVFEEDSAAGAVFKPEDADIPLSRRPRERLQLRAGGAATIWQDAADDRPVAEEATWTAEAGALVVRDRAGAVRARIVEQSPDRLLVKRS